jgi:hypothetical protein
MVEVPAGLFHRAGRAEVYLNQGRASIQQPTQEPIPRAALETIGKVHVMAQIDQARRKMRPNEACSPGN